MIPSPPSPPWQQESDDSRAAFDEYADRPTPHLPAPLADLVGSAADMNTQPVPTVSGSSTPPLAPAHSSQAVPLGRQADGALTVAERDTQPLPIAPASSPPGNHAARVSRNDYAAPYRHVSRHIARFQASPWLVRLALLLGLIALGVRAGYASAAFMAPGGSILGWSRLPTAHCAICHLPKPTTTQQSNQPLTPDQYAAMLLPQLTLDEKLGQMMIVQFVGLQPTPDAVQMMNAQGAGGMLLYEYNMSSPDQLRSLNAQLKQLSAIPPLLAVDQEGGTVNRFANIVGPLPSASSLKTLQDAEARGAQDGSLLSDFGFNLDLAPVVDVGTANPQLYERTFGSDPHLVAAMAGAYLEGLQQGGKVTGTLKHFPGLGDTTTDPHLGLPILSRSQADWESIDLEPYRALLKSEDVRAIMVTHELIPAVDPQYPASLSPTLINGVLRGELGYNGVVITDSLYMGALNQRWSVPQAAVLAIKAGADIIMGPSDPQTVQQVIDQIKQAITSGTLTQANIDTAVLRILALKIRMGLIPLPQ